MKNLFVSLASSNPYRDIHSYELAVARLNLYVGTEFKYSELISILEDKLSQALKNYLHEELRTHMTNKTSYREGFLIYAIQTGYETTNSKMKKVVDEILEKFPYVKGNIDNIMGRDEEFDQLEIIAKDENSRVSDLLFVIKSKVQESIKIDAINNTKASIIIYRTAILDSNREVRDHAEKKILELKGEGVMIKIHKRNIFLDTDRLASLKAGYKSASNVERFIDGYLVITTNPDSVLAKQCRNQFMFQPELSKIIGAKVYAGIWK